ncbi:MAG: molecular chaperone DnaJ [Bifidobacteriaceae bacterium]|nr:molecular chaperone DnaJ [Bifidobacteriaceae bacterium]
MNNDYYETLGVARNASPEDIKKSYRRLCRELHPDVAGASPDAEERIKDVNRAYQVLSDPDKRQQYDLGADPLAPGGGEAPFGFSGGAGGFQDLFDTLFTAATGGAAMRGPAPRRTRGRDLLESLTLDLPEAVFGTSRDLTVPTFAHCETCQGTCCAPGTSPRRCQTCGGRGMVSRVVRSLLGDMRTSSPCPDCQGFGSVIDSPCPECAGTGRVRLRVKVAVDVPAGVGTGTRLRIQGHGEAGPGGGPAGDLYIDIRVKAHPDFVRDGDDLHCTLQVPMTAAALGATLTVNTLDGEREVSINPGTAYGEVVTLDGLGVGRGMSGTRGDLRVHIEVQTPTPSSDEERDLLRTLAAMRGEEHPEAKLAHAGGVFSRLKDKLAGR